MPPSATFVPSAPLQKEKQKFLLYIMLNQLLKCRSKRSMIMECSNYCQQPFKPHHTGVKPVVQV